LTFVYLISRQLMGWLASSALLAEVLLLRHENAIRGGR
jgi:hypothetical protein